MQGGKALMMASWWRRVARRMRGGRQAHVRHERGAGAWRVVCRVWRVVCGVCGAHTLLTLAIMANTAASAMRVVLIPASASATAVLCPSVPGAVSATITSNVRFLCAFFRKAARRRRRVQTAV